MNINMDLSSVTKAIGVFWSNSKQKKEEQLWESEIGTQVLIITAINYSD